MRRSHRQRLLVALVGVPLVLAAIFLPPSEVFFALFLAVVALTAWEIAAILRHWAPSAPLGALVALAPLTGLALGSSAWGVSPGPEAFVLAVVLCATLPILLARTSTQDAAPAIGMMAFGMLYLGLPAASLFHLHRLDPWLIIALLAIVWLGDTAAYYAGSRFGRHKLSPVVSPKKSWEGAIAGLAMSVISAAIWSHLRLGEIGPAFLAVAAATAVVAQLGDLVESLMKRGAGVKDSSRLLPGHGGLLDRLDALLLAAPVFLVGLRLWIL